MLCVSFASAVNAREVRIVTKQRVTHSPHSKSGVVDLFNDYPANQTNYLSYNNDAYHPKEEGYAVIEELILNAIKNRL